MSALSPVGPVVLISSPSSLLQPCTQANVCILFSQYSAWLENHCFAEATSLTQDSTNQTRSRAFKKGQRKTTEFHTESDFALIVHKLMVLNKSSSGSCFFSVIRHFYIHVWFSQPLALIYHCLILCELSLLIPTGHMVICGQLGPMFTRMVFRGISPW